jgi:hypothetical protein
MTPVAFYFGEATMKRAIFVALGTGAVISSAAAFTSSIGSEPQKVARGEYQVAMQHQTARQAQRARIDGRYQADRARCDILSGFKRDKCLIQAHAARGRAMLEAAAPYEGVRS